MKVKPLASVRQPPDLHPAWHSWPNCDQIPNQLSTDVNKGGEPMADSTQHRTRAIDLVGQRFGRLTVIKRHGTKKNGNAAWLCQCDCGNKVVVDGYAMRHGVVNSCGCIRRENSQRLAKQNTAFIAQQHNGAQTLKNENGVYYASLHRGKRNRSGVVGVSFDRASGRWATRLFYQGRYVLLKMCDSYQEAVQLRREAEKKYLGKHKQ